MTEPHAHQWEETETGCDDCGSHPALMCVNEPCPDGYDAESIDLIRQDDPRETGNG